MRQVFISYVREDLDIVNVLVKDLRKYRVNAWIDRERLAPGQRWKSAIRSAITEGVLFLACFSSQYSQKNRSYMNEELTLAIEELRKRPVNRSWFIPIIFDNNSVPDRDVGAGESLHDFQWVDLSSGPGKSSWSKGIRKIVNLVDQGDGQDSRSKHDILSDRLRLAVQEKKEEELLGILRNNAHETIDAVLESFSDDEDQESYGYLMRPLCEVYGNQFSADQVIKLVTRGGKGNSRTGFHGLCALYDRHFNHMKDLNLHSYFVDNFQISYFIKLRERFPSKELLNIVMDSEQSSLKIDGAYVDKDYFWDKSMNRGESAFLDAVFLIEDNEEC